MRIWDKSEVEIVDGQRIEEANNGTELRLGFPTDSGAAESEDNPRQHRASYCVFTSEGKVFEFNSGITDRKRAVGMAVIWDRSGGFTITDDEAVIPIKIAVMGKPAMATYLYTVHDLSQQEIGEMLDVSKRTSQQYLSQVRRGHR